jgi:hypothetical protein
MNITIEIPSPLLQRLNRCEDFLSWTREEPAGTRRTLDTIIIQELETHCESVESDMITDESGAFIGDRLDKWAGVIPSAKAGEGN